MNEMVMQEMTMRDIALVHGGAGTAASAPAAPASAASAPAAEPGLGSVPLAGFMGVLVRLLLVAF